MSLLFFTLISASQTSALPELLGMLNDNKAQHYTDMAVIKGYFLASFIDTKNVIKND